ncbi:MAG: DUF2779 domain-containing protein [Burkholderiaceae bacterium]|nr:DUF2779 domain-containing protein [Burkholderiaceae bacterium]
MRNLSKSKLLAHRQCPKRLWLELKHPELVKISPMTQLAFDFGHEVGAVARKLYDPANEGVLIDPQRAGFGQAFVQSRKLLASSQPIFEAGFVAEGALAFADVLLPATQDGKRVWRMIEVKSATAVKDYHRDDAAIQAFVARSAGVALASIALAHVDSSWQYQGDGDYRGLLVEHLLTREAFAREDEVRSWIEAAQLTAAKSSEPDLRTGEHCTSPFVCGFLDHCRAQEPSAEHPVQWLPHPTNALKNYVARNAVSDLRDVPDRLLSRQQLRVKQQTLSGEAFFDAEGAAKDLRKYPLPAIFLDFETIQFAVPRWKGTRPYAQIPYQFSLHRLAADGALSEDGFIDLSGADPSEAIAEALIAACGEREPIFAYSAGFEKARIRELAARVERLATPLLAINERIVDLLPIAKERYYHPSQQGSWSIKKVLPAVAPDLSYGDLDGVNHGAGAIVAYLEAVDPDTSEERKVEIARQLREYCSLDTLAMVRLWQFLSGERAAGAI